LQLLAIPKTEDHFDGPKIITCGYATTILQMGSSNVLGSGNSNSLSRILCKQTTLNATELSAYK
jgi:hypothetical protein